MTGTSIVTLPADINLPARLQGADAAAQIAAANAAAAGGIKAGGFPRISIKANKFHEVDGGEMKTYMAVAAPGQPPVPLMCLEAVVVGANPALTKTYYEGEYKEGSVEAPDCSSSNGVTPDSHIVNKQHPVCATCPQNQWGSKISKLSGKEIKACDDSKQLVILPAADLSYKALGLSIGKGSLTNWGKYIQLLSSRNIPVSEVVTNITFDAMANGILQFAYNRFLDDAQSAQAAQRGRGDDVRSIVHPVQVVNAPMLAAPVAQAGSIALAVAPPVETVAVQPPHIVEMPADPFAGHPPHVATAVGASGGIHTVAGMAMFRALTGTDPVFTQAAAPLVPPVPAPAPAAGFGAGSPVQTEPTPQAQPTAAAFGGASTPAPAAPPAPAPAARKPRAPRQPAAPAPAAQPTGSIDLSYLPPGIAQAVSAVGADSPAGQALLAQFPPPAAPAVQAAPVGVPAATPVPAVQPVAATPVAGGFGGAVATPAVMPGAVPPTAAVSASGASLKALLEKKLGVNQPAAPAA